MKKLSLRFGLFGGTIFLSYFLLVNSTLAQLKLDVSLQAVPANYEGVCPAIINFKGKIVVNQPTKISYRFIRSDGYKSQIYNLVAEKAGDYPISDQWKINKNYSGWEAMEVLSTQKIVSNQASFSVKCTAVQPVPVDERPLANKADLVIDKILVEKVAQDPPNATPLKIKLRITFLVRNNGLVSTANSLTPEGKIRGSNGHFKVLVEGLNYPTGTYNQLSTAGFLALDAGQSKSAYFEEWVPAGASRKYRVTTDNLNWIEESSEGNNTMTAGYGID